MSRQARKLSSKDMQRNITKTAPSPMCQIDDNIPLMGFARRNHIEACMGYIYAPNADVNLAIFEDSSTEIGDIHAREIFDISRFKSNDIISFDKK